MNKDNIDRVTICFPKGQTEVVDKIDQARGQISRSEAIYSCLQYITKSTDQNQLKGILETKRNYAYEFPTTT